MQPTAQAVGKWETEKPQRGERLVLMHTLSPQWSLSSRRKSFFSSLLVSWGFPENLFFSCEIQPLLKISIQSAYLNCRFLLDGSALRSWYARLFADRRCWHAAAACGTDHGRGSLDDCVILAPASLIGRSSLESRDHLAKYLYYSSFDY